MTVSYHQLSNFSGASVGWLTTSTHFGALASTALAAWLLTFTTWRVCLFAFGLTGLLISVITFMLMPAASKEMSSRTVPATEKESTIVGPLAAAAGPLSLKELWMLPGVMEVTVTHLLFKFVG